jgi:hypothetical protein
MLRSKKAAARRSVKERIVETLVEEKRVENDCVLDAIEGKRLETGKHYQQRDT